MPIYEYEEYVKFLNSYYKEKSRRAEALSNNVPSVSNSKGKQNMNPYGTLN